MELLGDAECRQLGRDAFVREYTLGCDFVPTEASALAGEWDAAPELELAGLA